MATSHKDTLQAYLEDETLKLHVRMSQFMAHIGRLPPAQAVQLGKRLLGKYSALPEEKKDEATKRQAEIVERAVRAREHKPSN